MQANPGGIGLILLFLNDFQTLRSAAEAYFYLGYAVIPLFGDLDPNRPKVAARAWSTYQMRLASLDEIHAWFSAEGGAAGLGIVTGRISRLAVLDFDSDILWADFRHRFPDLLETRTIQSAGRGLPHLYFHVPAHLHLASLKRQGVDLLSDGRYVVAPPTTINGTAYRITRGGMPRSLTEHDLRRLHAFMSDQKSTPYTNETSTIPLAIKWRGTDVMNQKPAPLPAMPVADALPYPTKKDRVTRADLHGLYLYWRTKYARNDALFRTAIYARDHGWDQAQTRRALAALHVSQSNKGVEETQVVRQREAYATIGSAFSRPPRSTAPQPIYETRPVKGLLPNSVREALTQRKMTYVLRTLEGLLLAGFHAGRGFTADQAIQALKGTVGRDSVYNALNARASNGQPFLPQRIPSALPKASNEAAVQKQPLKTKKCFFVTKKNSGIKKRGLKARRFKMPRVQDLCHLLGVKDSGSDPLTLDDLRSAHQTRMALHRELIKRRPGEYSRRWLAHRLGVSRRTLDTYNHLIPIHTRPIYQETLLSWQNIDGLLMDEILNGAFIETLAGKKYPALHAIAARLLAKGSLIRLKRRSGNLYWYGSDDPPPNILRIDDAIPIEPQRHREQSDQKERDYENRPYPTPISANQSAKKVIKTRRNVSGVSPQQVRAASAVEDIQPRSPAPAALSPAKHEALAQNMYTQITGLSLKNARKFASTYSEKHILFALNRLQQRGNLANPSGFFVSVLRSTARMEKGS